MYSRGVYPLGIDKGPVAKSKVVLVDESVTIEEVERLGVGHVAKIAIVSNRTRLTLPGFVETSGLVRQRLEIHGFLILITESEGSVCSKCPEPVVAV